jgi:hypothetical protein
MLLAAVASVQLVILAVTRFCAVSRYGLGKGPLTY